MNALLYEVDNWTDVRYPSQTPPPSVTLMSMWQTYRNFMLWFAAEDKQKIHMKCWALFPQKKM